MSRILSWLLPLLSAILIIGSLDADISLSQFIFQECLGVLLVCAAHLVAENEPA